MSDGRVLHEVYVSSIAEASTDVARWVEVGHSSVARAYRAGKEAAAAALRGRRAKLLVVFCSDSYDLAELLAGVRAEAGEVPLVGCSTAGEIATGGPDDASVVIVAFGGSGFSIATHAATGVAGRLREAGEEVAGCVAEIDEREHRVLLMLSDGLAGNQQEILRGVYAVVGAAVPLVGGCAGDDLKMKRTFQLHGDQVLTDAVVAAAVGSDAPLGIGVRHGWSKIGEPMLVTRSANNRVYLLDDKPALDVYLTGLRAPPQAWSDPAAFTRLASTHPLGLSRRSEELQVRFIGEADFEERSLVCVAEVPQGGLAWFMAGDEESVLEATDAACSQALQALQGRSPLGVIAFDCIARRGVLGDQGIRSEVERIAAHAGGSPVAGFYTYGEIARTKGISGFHNQTLVVLAVS